MAILMAARFGRIKPVWDADDSKQTNKQTRQPPSSLFPTSPRVHPSTLLPMRPTNINRPVFRCPEPFCGREIPLQKAASGPHMDQYFINVSCLNALPAV
jgi:hypothetical protein